MNEINSGLSVFSLGATIATKASSTGKGAASLTAAITGTTAVEKLAKVGDTLTVAQAASQLADGHVEEAATTITGAQIDRAIGATLEGACLATPGAEEFAPVVGPGATAVSGSLHIGEYLAGPLVDHVAQAFENYGKVMSNAADKGLNPGIFILSGAL